MLSELQALCEEFDFSVAEVDVDGDLALHLRYGDHVPVLAAGERELCRHFLDAVMVRDYLGDFR
jgi:thioredoxin reductase (NADPH)